MSDELTPEQLAELEAKLAAEEAERARVQALTDRFNAINDPYLCPDRYRVRHQSPGLANP